MTENDQTGGTVPVARDLAGLRLRSKKIRVEILRGPNEGTVLSVAGPAARIGSGKECDVVLNDPTVSRHHLTLRIEGEDIRIVDEGSRNGTTVDGVRVRDGYARPDSAIAIGDSTLRLRMLSEVVEVPLSTGERFGDMIGKSAAIRRIFGLLERLSPTDTTVLVEGETGTGKELVARGLHDAGSRADKPLVIFDCSAVSASLMESELFGHKRGSFTGAITDQPGHFEAADGGTLFLDEIGELPLDLQPKLLRALEAREVRRVGESKPRRIDVRIIAATNRSLSREVDRGRFREDLYYRLAVVTVRLPPLRERIEDIPLLVRHLEKSWSSRPNPPPPLPEAVVLAFAAQAWPGNIRELRNAVDRALSIGYAGLTEEPPASLTEPPLPPEALGVSLATPLLVGRERLLEAYEKAYLELALEETGGNVSRTAELAGVGRKFVQQAMKRYGLRGQPEE